MSGESVDFCGAVPALPRLFVFAPCGKLKHPISEDHVSYQDGVTITWNEERIEAFKKLIQVRKADGPT